MPATATYLPDRLVQRVEDDLLLVAPVPPPLGGSVSLGSPTRRPLQRLKDLLMERLEIRFLPVRGEQQGRTLDVDEEGIIAVLTHLEPIAEVTAEEVVFRPIVAVAS